jgi:hypothetical protein
MERGSIPGFLLPLYPQRPPQVGLSSANPRPRRTRAKVGVALGICLLTLSLATAQAIRAYVPAAETRPRLELVPGSDSSRACAVFPCGQASVEGSGEALVSMSLGIESPGPLQAETYYTDLLRLVNPTGQAVTVSSITVSEVSLTRSGDLGAVTVYYCPLQSDDPARDCPGQFTLASGAGGSLSMGPQSIAPGSTAYLEFSGFAGVAAQPGDKISFELEVTAE